MFLLKEMKKLETDTFRVFLRGFVFVVFVSYVMFVSSNIMNMILDTYRSKKKTQLSSYSSPYCLWPILSSSRHACCSRVFFSFFIL